MFAWLAPSPKARSPLLVGNCRLPTKTGSVWQDAWPDHIRPRLFLSDIDANAVIDSGQVFAIGQGGRMVALELNSGQRMWELNIAGISTPWVAGDWVFVATDDGKLIAVARNSGKVRWINQLPRFEREKSKRGQITYRGPVLAGGRLVLVGSNGTLINSTAPATSRANESSAVSLAPVVANRRFTSRRQGPLPVRKAGSSLEGAGRDRRAPCSPTVASRTA